MNEHPASVEAVSNNKRFEAYIIATFGMVLVGSVVALSIEAVDHQNTASATTCLTPTAEDYAAVDAALSDTSNPNLRQWPHTGAQRYTNQRSQYAKHLGLTFHSFNPDNNHDPAHVIQELQSFAQQYGLEIGYETKDPKRTPNESEKNSPDAAQAMLQLGSNLSDDSVEYINTTGVRKVTFFSSKHGADPNIMDYAAIFATDHAIYMNIGLPNDGFNHESGHHLHARFCGPDGMGNDTQYADLNGPRGTKVYQNTWPPAQLSPQELLLTNEGLSQTEAETVKTLDLTSLGYNTNRIICATQDKLKDTEKDVLVVSNYSLTTEVEDVAEMNKVLLNPKLHSHIFDRHKPRVYAKARLLAARLHHLNSKVTEYLLRVGSRPTNCSQVLEK